MLLSRRVKARKHSGKLLLCGLRLSLGFETRKLQHGRGKYLIKGKNRRHDTKHHVCNGGSSSALTFHRGLISTRRRAFRTMRLLAVVSELLSGLMIPQDRSTGVGTLESLLPIGDAPIPQSHGMAYRL
jgi:hypothetical protein